MSPESITRWLGTVLDEVPLALVLEGIWEPPAASLRELSGDGRLADPEPFPSGLMKRVARAWVAPLGEFTCAQLRVLLGQQFGLEWLARPAALFVRHFPRVETDLYPGDVTMNALRAYEPLLRFAPLETREMLQGDFTWIEAEIAENGDETGLLREALEGLARGRQMAATS